MSAEQIFSLCGGLAMIGWAGLVFLPRWGFTRDWLAPVLVPLAIAVVYVWLMATHVGSAPAGGGFDSLAGVKTLFTVDHLLLAGWIHYLAFDLFVGAWEVRDAQRRGIHHLLVLPCMAATLIAGPGGLLLYWLVRLAHRAWAGRTPAPQAA
ncbi:MAG: ABA4-like family protein [Pseudomonadota bacterium]